MKKLFTLTAAAILAASSLFAGEWHAGGALGAWRNSTDNTTSVTIKPEISYSITPRWLAGMTFGYQYLYSGGEKNSSLIIDPYARYYYFKENKVNLFVDGGVDIALGRTRYNGAKSKTSAAFGIGLRPGVDLAISKRFSLVAHFGFLGYKGANKAAQAGGFKKGFGFDFSNGVDFGFYYNF